MDHLSLSVQNLAPSVRVITNVGNFHTPVIEERSTSPVQKVGCLPAELIKVFQKEPLSHPPAMAASNKRYAEEAIKRIFSFHSSHLNTFLNAYMYPNARIPEDVLDEIRLLCANGDSDWAYRCQRLALEVLEKAVFAKTQQVVPSMKLDDPTSLSALRGVLPVMVPVPSVAMKLCHFFFIGLSPCTAEEGSGSGAGGDRDSNESGGSDRIPEEGEGGRGKGRINLAEDLLSLMAAEKLVIKNKGYKPFRLEISQTQTVVDNVREVKEKRSVFPLDNPVDVKPGDRLELFLTNLAPVLPSTHFSYFQQLIVFSIEGVFRIFVTVTVVSVSPPQPLALNFPACLPLPVKDSVIGAYSAPLFLQWLKYLFSIRGGYRDASVSHLLLGKSANFQLHNEGIMQVVARLRRSVLEDLPILKTLDAFWAGFSRVPKKTHTLLSSRHIPPGSPSCPEKYFSCSSTFSSSSSSWWRPRCSDEENETIFYPNPGTPFPDDLKEISSSVLFGLMLQWLAETPVNVFDTSCINCDPISYLQAAPSHHRGILMYIIDLCCSFVAFRKFNGVTPRTLALTFASVLCRQPRHHSLASIDGSTSSFETYVVTQQSAVSALLCWMQVFGWRYPTQN